LRLPYDKQDSINHFIHYLCINRKDNWRYKLRRRSEKGIQFLMLFNPNVTEIAMQALKPHQMLLVLQNLRNLTTIDFRVTHSRACLTIGRFCKHLRKVRFVGRFITTKASQIICFLDYPTNRVKNAGICKNLEEFDAWVSEEALTVFMENLSALKTVSRENIADYTSLVAESRKSNRKIFPCKLDYVRVMAKHENVNLDEVYKKFPNLNTLDLTCTKDQTLAFTENLETLLLHYYDFSGEPFVEMPDLSDMLVFSFYPRPSYIKHLALDFIDHIASVDLAEISQRCPNLQTLFLGNCEHRRDEIFIPFPNLEKLLISTTGDVFSCLPIDVLAPTLKTLGIKKNDVTSCFEDLTAGLLSYSFPNLEFLEYSPSKAATEEEVLQLLVLCPKLTNLGIAKATELWKDINFQASMLNWNLTIHEARNKLMDLF